MCGLAGVFRRDGGTIDLEGLARMASALRHRGPDGYGFWADPRVGLAHVRLSIIDPARGAQPMTNEDGRVVVAYNGEIYNHRALRRRLEAAGHRFRTACDTEVLVHGWEEWGRSLLLELEGQFAFALYDRAAGVLVLARDRFGILPLLYASRPGALFFGSEAKALFASGEVPSAPDPLGLDQVFTLWSAQPPRTVFAGVRSVEPGTALFVTDRGVECHRYHEHRFETVEPRRDVLDELEERLASAVENRLMADVPVGVYVSGGVDSGVVAALVRARDGERMPGFSVGFEQPSFDESAEQDELYRALGLEPVRRRISNRDIAEALPEVIAHVESPLTRTAPVPLFLLSEVVRGRGVKVTLTGEGADEAFLGYDIFKETVIREFCLRQPASTRRPRLFDRLYPEVRRNGSAGEFWRRSFLQDTDTRDPLFSHRPRFRLSARTRELYGPGIRDGLGDAGPLDEVVARLPAGFAERPALARAAWLELTTFLSPYLLAAQGDRVAMAHGVEARYPFLDSGLFAFASSLPDRFRLPGLREKAVLRRLAKRLLPEAVARRRKQPYLAPDTDALAGPDAPEYVHELLEPGALRASGLFSPQGIAVLLRRAAEGRAGTREAQALVGILTAQLWHHRFLSGARPLVSLPMEGADVCLVRHADIAQETPCLP